MAIKNELVKKLVLNILSNWLQRDYVDGITFSGGDPLDQDRLSLSELMQLIKWVRRNYPNKTIWCYTGYLFDKELLENSRAHCEITKDLISYFDVMVDGEFIDELKDISLRFKGSSNQRIIDVQKSLKENKVVLSKFNEKRTRV